MDLEEIYELVEDAETGIEILNVEANSYRQDLEDFYNTESTESGFSHTRLVSKQMLREETRRISETVPEYQEMVENLEAALPELDDYTDFRYVNGEQVSTTELKDKAEHLIDGYREILERIWHTGFRIKQDPELEVDPIEMRYNLWRKEIKQESDSSPEVLGELFS